MLDNCLLKMHFLVFHWVSQSAHSQNKESLKLSWQSKFGTGSANNCKSSINITTDIWFHNIHKNYQGRPHYKKWSVLTEILTGYQGVWCWVSHTSILAYPYEIRLSGIYHKDIWIMFLQHQKAIHNLSQLWRNFLIFNVPRESLGLDRHWGFWLSGGSTETVTQSSSSGSLESEALMIRRQS